MRPSIIVVLGLLASLQPGHPSEQAFNNIPRDDVRAGLISVTGGETLTHRLTHPFPEILYVVEGELDWVQGTEPFTAPAGTVVLVPTGTAHTLSSASEAAATLFLENTGTARLRRLYFWWAPGGDTSVFG